MKRIWQTEWQGIQFASVMPVSSTKLAGAEFYNDFYRALFQKYTGFDDLNLDWRHKKDDIAEFIACKLPDGARVLSVGCGLGYIEQYLHRKHGSCIELHVSDYASGALRWLKDVLPLERIHYLGGDQIDDHSYDLVYLAAVDYALDDQILIETLTHYREKLTNTGQILLISASFLEESGMKYFVRFGKDILKAVLDNIGLRNRGQLWGWMRTRDEYQVIMTKAGFSGTEDGFINTGRQHTYWISGNFGKSN